MSRIGKQPVAIPSGVKVQVDAGKAASEQQILALLDKMKDSKRFGDLKLLDMRDAGKNTREKAFSISFLYKPE